MNIIDIIEIKKNKQELTKEQVSFFVSEYTQGNIPDYQASALLMAIYINSMTDNETLYLTEAMIDSGMRLKFDKTNKKVVDKHSTGGVGDKTSLVLVPLLASLGFEVSKMSGRGLGHTGGTIDKLESFKGFSVERTTDEIYKQVEEIGCVIVGQSKDIVPADKKLYALRDVTATVNSIPLIASSIMSKKLALGADVILLDVKYGSGAFMKTKEEAKILGETLIKIGSGFGKNTIACITSMEQPLGKNIGNILEVKEAIDTLKGKGNKELRELCIMLGAQYLLVDNDYTYENAKEQVAINLDNGKAYNKFKELLIYQGANKEDIEQLPSAKHTYELKLGQEGYVKEIIANKVGHGAMLLGAGRQVKEDEIDLEVGLELVKKVGDKVNIEDVCVIIHYNDDKNLEEVKRVLKDSFVFSTKKIKAPDVLEEIIKG